MHQAFYRIFALSNNNWKVLHGSAVLVNGKAILFGDDGQSIGKTTASLFLKQGLLDSKYIADEFVLYKGGYVYPNSNYPIHCKPSSKTFMEDIFDKYEEYLLLDENDYALNPTPLGSIVCPKPSGKNKLTRLYGDRAKNALKCTAYSHLVKLHHPEYDRFNVFTGTKEEKAIKNIVKLVSIYPNFDNIPIYELQLKDPKDLVNILKKGGLFMDKKIKNHVSCGGVLFNSDMSKVYLIHKDTRDDWMLPKGHVEEDEELIATAVREVSEETGHNKIEVLDTDPVHIIEYDFELEEEPEFYHHKIVRFYLMKTDSKQVKTKEMKEESLSGEWVNVSEVVEKLTYDNEKNVARKATERME